MYGNEFRTKGSKIYTKDKIEPQHRHVIMSLTCDSV